MIGLVENGHSGSRIIRPRLNVWNEPHGQSLAARPGEMLARSMMSESSERPGLCGFMIGVLRSCFVIDSAARTKRLSCSLRLCFEPLILAEGSRGPARDQLR